jgi:tetratricopeptide (TPR) repeat protein
MGRATVRRLIVAAGLVAATAVCPGAGADPPPLHVIGPGHEAQIGHMLGERDHLGGCSLDEARTERTRITAKYRCGRDAVIVILAHPDDARDAPARTTRFAITAAPPNQSLLDAVAASVRANEAGFEWAQAQAAPLEGAKLKSAPPPPAADGGAPVADGGVTITAPPPPNGADKAALEEYLAAQRLEDAGRHAEAFDALVRLIRANPKHLPDGALGLLVSALASQTPPADVEADCLGRYRAQADAHPDDALDQYIAGVAAHYCGHVHARTKEEKDAFYRTAISYLSRVVTAFDTEPRVFVYMAISHHRLGEEPEARVFIERAMKLARKDPDVDYCDAEIFVRADLPRAIADIRRYLATVEELHKQEGAPINPGKHRRVEGMLAYLEKVQQGRATLDTELWDPLPRPHHKRWWMLVLRGLAILAVAGLAIAIALRLARALRRT